MFLAFIKLAKKTNFKGKTVFFVFLNIKILTLPLKGKKYDGRFLGTFLKFHILLHIKVTKLPSLSELI